MPKAVREAMADRRRVRAADHAYCGPDCFRGAFLARRRLLVLETVRALRAVRRAEEAGILGVRS